VAQRISEAHPEGMKLLLEPWRLVVTCPRGAPASLHAGPGLSGSG
jgi:hypothetical protein